MWNCEYTLFGFGPYAGNGPSDNRNAKEQEVVHERAREAFERAATGPQHKNAVLSQFQAKPQPQPRAITKKSPPQPKVPFHQHTISDRSPLNPVYPCQPFAYSEPEVSAYRCSFSTGSEEGWVRRPFCSSLPSQLRCSPQENGLKERQMMRIRIENFLKAYDEGKVDLDEFVIPPEERQDTAPNQLQMPFHPQWIEWH